MVGNGWLDERVNVETSCWLLQHRSSIAYNIHIGNALFVIDIWFSLGFFETIPFNVGENGEKKKKKRKKQTKSIGKWITFVAIFLCSPKPATMCCSVYGVHKTWPKLWSICWLVIIVVAGFQAWLQSGFHSIGKYFLFPPSSGCNHKRSLDIYDFVVVSYGTMMF